MDLISGSRGVSHCFQDVLVAYAACCRCCRTFLLEKVAGAEATRSSGGLLEFAWEVNLSFPDLMYTLTNMWIRVHPNGYCYRTQHILQHLQTTTWTWICPREIYRLDYTQNDAIVEAGDTFSKAPFFWYLLSMFNCWGIYTLATRACNRKGSIWRCIFYWRISLFWAYDITPPILRFNEVWRSKLCLAGLCLLMSKWATDDHFPY